MDISRSIYSIGIIIGIYFGWIALTNNPGILWFILIVGILFFLGGIFGFIFELFIPKIRDL